MGGKLIVILDKPGDMLLGQTPKAVTFMEIIKQNLGFDNLIARVRGNYVNSWIVADLSYIPGIGNVGGGVGAGVWSDDNIVGVGLPLGESQGWHNQRKNKGKYHFIHGESPFSCNKTCQRACQGG